MSALVMAIDPGATGAIAVFDTVRGDLVELIDTPTEAYQHRNTAGKMVTKTRVSPAAMALVLRRFARQQVHVYIEQVWAMPGQGVSSTFAFGECYGIARGVVAAMGFRTILVAPRTWLNSYGLGSDKNSHRAAARTLLPRHERLFARVKDDGRADAALLGLWGLRRWSMQQPKGIGHLPPDVVTEDGDLIRF